MKLEDRRRGRDCQGLLAADVKEEQPCLRDIGAKYVGCSCCGSLSLAVMMPNNRHTHIAHSKKPNYIRIGTGKYFHNREISGILTNEINELVRGSVSNAE
ncbi:hypothetical protein C0J52_13670 [Blattella germanica]|nr:hypothetical protein C0J52_13670 [Blattella germanica]